MKKKIAVGLSGGVDSAFAAYLLCEQGWDVIGFTLKFYPEENRCCDLDSLYQAQRLCHRLNIPHYVIDVKGIFQKKIIRYFIESYLNGLTPNPCSFCNRYIKFGYLWDIVRVLGIDYLATGHYARIERKDDIFLLKTAKDRTKTQEYFLALISPDILGHLVFPLANYMKEEVQKNADENRLLFYKRKESQDICFVKERSYSNFIEKNISLKRDYQGLIKHIEGKVLGRHRGIYQYTYGQRTGLGIAWTEPLYVIDIDYHTNTVVVGEKKYLNKNTFLVSSVNWFVPYEKKIENVQVKIRYNSSFYWCDVTKEEDGLFRVDMKGIANAITPGQIAVFYSDGFVLGGGVICKE